MSRHPSGRDPVGRRRGTGPGPLVWLGALVVLYLTVPLVAFLIRLARSSERGFTTPGLPGALWVSIASATISTALIAIFGIPLAYSLARSRGRLAQLVGTVVYLPLALPPLMGGILLIYLVGPYSTLGRAFDRRLTDSLAGVVLAQTFVAAPFLIVTARSAFSAQDASLDEVAAALGHRPIARFLRVALPVARDGIRAGLLLAWLRAFGEYGATVLLAYHPSSLPIYTYTQFSGSGLATTEAPTALALAVAAIAVTVGRARWPARSPYRWPAPWSTKRTENDSLPARVAPGPVEPAPLSFDLDVSVGGFRLQAAHRAETARLAILGPSGSGKSVTLRSLAGILGPGAGEVCYGALPVTEIPVEQRRIGYVPQGYSLLPHLDVWGQVCFGVGANPSLAAYWLDAFHLSDLVARRPGELSGGQRQRVCLAQALARRPGLLLLDEPFSALDAPVRDELRHELRRLQHEQGLSSVLVTHDPEEAALLADEIVVLVDGHVVQTGSAADLHRRPASAVVARLLGIANVLPGVVGADGTLEAGGLRLGVRGADIAPRSAVEWCIHPEHIEVVGEDGSRGGRSRSGSDRLPAEVVDAADLGAATSLDLRIGSDLVVRARSTSRQAAGTRSWRAGEICHVRLPSDAITVWPVEPSRHRQAAGAERP